MSQGLAAVILLAFIAALTQGGQPGFPVGIGSGCALTRLHKHKCVLL